MMLLVGGNRIEYARAHAGVSQLTAGRDSARAAIDEAVEERATKLFRKIEYLNVIGNVSPMIGLLGTVLGMIKAFSRIFSAAGGMPDPGKLAGDIAMALVTTFWGILIAIPALTFFALFRNRIDAFAAEYEAIITAFLMVNFFVIFLGMLWYLIGKFKVAERFFDWQDRNKLNIGRDMVMRFREKRGLKLVDDETRRGYRLGRAWVGG